jgi:hypothetical protein
MPANHPDEIGALFHNDGVSRSQGRGMANGAALLKEQSAAVGITRRRSLSQYLIHRVKADDYQEARNQGAQECFHN